MTCFCCGVRPSTRIVAKHPRRKSYHRPYDEKTTAGPGFTSLPGCFRVLISQLPNYSVPSSLRWQDRVGGGQVWIGHFLLSSGLCGIVVVYNCKGYKTSCWFWRSSRSSSFLRCCRLVAVQDGTTVLQEGRMPIEESRVNY